MTATTASRGRSERSLANLRPFQKGQSGNPSGRAKTIKEVRDMAREEAPRAFRRVVKLIDSEDERVAFVAAQEVLNRAYGKPTQQVEVRRQELSDLSDAELEAILVRGLSGAAEHSGPLIEAQASSQESDTVY